MRSVINSNQVLQLIAGIGLLVNSACSSNGKEREITVTNDVALVKVAFPAAGPNQDITVSGQVEAIQSANISTRVMGYITKIDVKAGDKVSRGQLLATISNDDITAKKAQAEAMITEARAGYKSAKKDYERFSALYNQQSASAKELDNITFQFHSAEARLEAAKQMLNEVNASLKYTRLTAPFSGTVTQKMMDAGSMANPGVPLLTIEQSGGYQVSASVPENEISFIHEGAAASITISAVNKTIRGKITQINPSSTNTGGQYVIKVNVPDSEKQGLFAGMYTDVVIRIPHMIKGTTSGQISVPVSAIEYKDQLTGLYTVGSNHTALLRWVRLGKTKGDRVEVLSGLSANESFIVSAEGRLYNGVPVKIN